MKLASTPPRDLSVVIPTLAEERTIERAVANAFAAGADEVIVADGGSPDATVALAKLAGARVVIAPRGRGPQLNVGAAAARCDALLFQHADVRLPRDAARAVLAALAEPRTLGGNFRVRFGGTLHGRLLAAFYEVIRSMHVCYGDSAIFCRRDAFEHLGGFPPSPIMEDLTFVRRLRRHGRFAHLAETVHASPRRWEQGGIAQAWASWIVIQSLYEFGVPPARLGALYRHIR